MGDLYPRFTVAAVQAAPVMFDREKTIDKAVHLIEEAAEKGAQIIGFPETFIPGHPNLWYKGKKTNPLPFQGNMFKQYVANSVAVPSPATEKLCAAARKARAFVIIGIAEQDSSYLGTLYLSQLIISSNGEIMGVHRKLVSTLEEKFIFTYGDGSYQNVYETPFGKLSAMNCGEHAHSLFKYSLLALGTQIHVASWPSFPGKIYNPEQRDSVDFRVRQFAHEGKIFVINSCSICDQQNIEFCCNTDEEKEGLIAGSGGGSSIIGPGGNYLAGPLPEGEGVLTAEISLEDTMPGKQMHNVVGHYTRWDIFSLKFNQQRLMPFQSTGSLDVSTTDNSELEEIRSELRGLKKQLKEMGGRSKNGSL